MVTVEDIRGLTMDEKPRVMEMIWSELTATSDHLDSPRCHEAVLKMTAERVANGEKTGDKKLSDPHTGKVLSGLLG